MDTKDITLKITGKQIYKDGEEETMEFVTEGKISRADGTVYLTYEESELSGMPGCKTLMVFADDHISMQRLGETQKDESLSDIYDSMNVAGVIEFREGARHRGVYETPYGDFDMEVLTNSIVNNLRSDGSGDVSIDYNISLHGLSTHRNQIHIQIV
ncbi:MAG: DUF1934 domain-containing protein [Clostridia bacterium]|nr:DUF1934 domain-containing protein [Clostridia bacterium]